MSKPANPGTKQPSASRPQRGAWSRMATMAAGLLSMMGLRQSQREETIDLLRHARSHGRYRPVRSSKHRGGKYGTARRRWRSGLCLSFRPLGTPLGVKFGSMFDRKTLSHNKYWARVPIRRLAKEQAAARIAAGGKA